MSNLVSALRDDSLPTERYVWKAKKKGFVSLPLFKAYSGKLAQIKGKQPVLGLRVSFAKEEHTAKLCGVFVRARLRGMKNGRN